MVAQKAIGSYSTWLKQVWASGKLLILAQFYKNFLQLQFTNVHNKLEYLSPASMSSVV